MRTDTFERLAREAFDLLVIGGGITGMGIAQDAAARGMRVVLVDKGDFASGTSSKSSKLIHGGLRYLQQLDLAVTRESCRERNLLRRLAPGLVESLRFLIPLSGWDLRSLLFSVGLMAYDRLAGTTAPSERHVRIGRAEAFRLAPQLKRERITSGLLYYDAVTEDARLTLTVARSAARLGAVLVNYAPVVQLLKTGSRVCGGVVQDLFTARAFEAKARAVVNASGVWIDSVQALDRKDDPARIYPAKGIHITISPDRLPVQTAVVVPSARDRRLLFVIPWFGVTVIGTTDTFYKGSIDQPYADADDVDYVLDAVNRTFTGGLTRQDILSTYAGLRPLVKDGAGPTTDVSRRHTIFESDSGLLTIAGGKLTTYRRMAADLVDRVARRLSIASPCRTDQIPLVVPWSPVEDPSPVLDPETRAYLGRVYGSEAQTIASLAGEHPSLAERLLPEWPYIQAEVLYAVRHERACTVEDFLARRTRIILQDKRQGLGCAGRVADLMAKELGWDAHVREQQLQRYTDYARRHRAPE